MNFQNAYADRKRAQAYDELELGGTYRLVFDRLPQLLSTHVAGTRALDFGCGTGRSSRFLAGLGFEVAGIDVSEQMISIARHRDPRGRYRAIADGDFSTFADERFDLILSTFVFDNVPSHQNRVRLFSGLSRMLAPQGRIVIVVSTPEIYTNEWVTFTTRDFPENRTADCGDIVRIVTTDYSDARPVEDILWTAASYRAVYRESGLKQVHSESPLATGKEGICWLSETTIAPWRIDILERATDL